MNDDYEKGYQDGYEAGQRDGYQKGWHEARRQKDTYVPNQFEDRNKCPKCQTNLANVMGYVCMSPNCPCGRSSTC